MHLLNIVNSAENVAATGLLVASSTREAYLGISYDPSLSPAGSRVFGYGNGVALGYSAWGVGEPNNLSGGFGPENCVKLQNSGLWLDIICNTSIPVFCESYPGQWWYFMIYECDDLFFVH